MQIQSLAIFFINVIKAANFINALLSYLLGGVQLGKKR
jgi:hypothetical protein